MLYQQLDYPEIFTKIVKKREASWDLKKSYKKSNWLPEFKWVELSPHYIEQDNIM